MNELLQKIGGLIGDKAGMPPDVALMFAGFTLLILLPSLVRSVKRMRRKPHKILPGIVAILVAIIVTTIFCKVRGGFEPIFATLLVFMLSGVVTNVAVTIFTTPKEKDFSYSKINDKNGHLVGKNVEVIEDFKIINKKSMVGKIKLDDMEFVAKAPIDKNIKKGDIVEIKEINSIDFIIFVDTVG
jgi:hypothetical protein